MMYFSSVVFFLKEKSDLHQVLYFETIALSFIFSSSVIFQQSRPVYTSKRNTMSPSAASYPAQGAWATSYFRNPGARYAAPHPAAYGSYAQQVGTVSTSPSTLRPEKLFVSCDQKKFLSPKHVTHIFGKKNPKIIFYLW